MDTVIELEKMEIPEKDRPEAGDFFIIEGSDETFRIKEILSPTRWQIKEYSKDAWTSLSTLARPR